MYWNVHDTHSIGSLPADQRQSALASSSSNINSNSASVDTNSEGTKKFSGSRVTSGVTSGNIVQPASLRLTATHNDDPHDTAGPKYAAHFEVKGFRAAVGAEQVRIVYVFISCSVFF